jgi:MFS family permease
MHGMLRVPRSRGVLSGVLLILLGAWGALVPFVGPYFQYAYTPDHAWTYTTGRLWLSILPGAATVLGGLIVLISASRPLAHFGAWLAALSGAWFALGSVIGPTWIGTQMATGTPVGGSSTRALEQIGFYTGLGIAIVLVAGMALGRFSVIGVREARRAEPAEPVTPAEHAEPVTAGAAARTGAFDRPGTADKPATGDTPATTTTGTPASRRFGLRHKEPTTGTAEPATEPVSPSNM